MRLTFDQVCAAPVDEVFAALTDAECLVKARATSECLTFLVSELASRRQHRERFKSMVGDL